MLRNIFFSLMSKLYKFIYTTSTTTLNVIAEVDVLLSLYVKQEICQFKVFYSCGLYQQQNLAKTFWDLASLCYDYITIVHQNPYNVLDFLMTQVQLLTRRQRKGYLRCMHNLKEKISAKTTLSCNNERAGQCKTQTITKLLISYENKDVWYCHAWLNE